MNSVFTDQAVAIECCGELVLLHPDKVLLWQSRATLFAADIHIGKEHTFAKAGIPVPAGISENTLDKLMQLIDDSAAQRLVVLGDLLHARPDETESWQTHLSTLLSSRNELTVQVVIGNHDSETARAKVTARLDWIESLDDPPFLFKHEPYTHTERYVIGGHIHPAYRLRLDRQTIRAPVFWLRKDHMVLPAFGEFTGGHVITPASSDRIFPTLNGSVFELPV